MDTALANAVYSFGSGILEVVPIADIPLNVADIVVLTKNQALMAYKMALALGLTASAISSVALPFLARSEAGALIGLFFFYITFEFVMVSHVPMMTEILPGARATLMSFNLTGHSIGRGIGALLATFVYQSFGFPVVAGLAMMFNLFGLLALRKMRKK